MIITWISTCIISKFEREREREKKEKREDIFGANCGGDLSLEGVKIMGCKWDLYEFRIGRMRATRRVQSWYAIVLVESLPVGRSWPNSYRVAELCRGIDYAAYNVGFIRGSSCSPDLPRYRQPSSSLLRLCYFFLFFPSRNSLNFAPISPPPQNAILSGWKKWWNLNFAEIFPSIIASVFHRSINLEREYPCL